MRFFLFFVAVFSSLQAQASWWSPRGVALKTELICTRFIVMAQTHSLQLVPAEEAVRFIRENGGNTLTRERQKRLERDALSGLGSTSFILEQNDVTTILEGMDPIYVAEQHQLHAKARGSIQNAFFCMELTLTVLIVALLKLNRIDLGQVTGVRQLGNQGVQIGIGGTLSRLSSGWLAYSIFGPSYREFATKVFKAIDNESTSPLSYGHGVVNSPYYNIEILYAPDTQAPEFSPRLLVHITEKPWRRP